VRPLLRESRPWVHYKSHQNAKTPRKTQKSTNVKSLTKIVWFQHQSELHLLAATLTITVYYYYSVRTWYPFSIPSLVRTLWLTVGCHTLQADTIDHCDLYRCMVCKQFHLSLMQSTQVTSMQYVLHKWLNLHWMPLTKKKTTGWLFIVAKTTE